MSNTYCVIMAGGIGSRFWPVSTAKLPKQFHDILGTGETLIQQTFRRLKGVAAPEHILVVTHKNYRNLVAEQLPELPTDNIILEPARRNTAPCIAYAAYRILAKDPNANMLVAPSDHLISDQKEFERIANLALRTAQQNNYLLTLGIKPHRPDTGYGYIQFMEQEQDLMDEEVKLVKTFTEKPNEELAQQFLDSGDFLWNSGIFIWSAQTFRKELEQHQNDLYKSFEAGVDKFGTEKEKDFVEEVYPSFENESIDYGLMEKSANVYVIPAEFGWSDLGTWGSLYEHSERDEKENAIQGKKVLTYDARGNIIRVGPRKKAVVEGLENMILIDTKEALLVCKMENEQLIKAFVSDLKVQFGEERS